jgi:SH3-like domain-containing protein
MRVGPGMRYPILWVYGRRHLPVEIWQEFGPWRYVRDMDGVKGWMHAATLTGRRSFVVTGTQRVLRESPNAHAEPVARLNPGVVGWLRRCNAGVASCRVEVAGYSGWLPRQAFWGTLPNEAVAD